KNPESPGSAGACCGLPEALCREPKYVLSKFFRENNPSNTAISRRLCSPLLRLIRPQLSVARAAGISPAASATFGRKVSLANLEVCHAGLTSQESVYVEA